MTPLGEVLLSSGAVTTLRPAVVTLPSTVITFLSAVSPHLSMRAPSLTVPMIQVSPVAVAGTVGSLIVLLTVTAHIAARNVLGDVSFRKAIGVGPVTAPFAMLPEAFGVDPALAIGLAIVVDFFAITYLYDRRWQLSAYIAVIHVVVSILLGAILVGLFLLLASIPG